MDQLFDVKKFYYYKRYKWSELEFQDLQTTLLLYPSMLFQSMLQGGVLSGYDNSSNLGLTVNVDPGVAVNDVGDLLAMEFSSAVVVTNNIKSLIVARPVFNDTNPITRPTIPFDSVPLNKEQTTEIVKIDGTLGAYPTKASEDVVLFGVTASGGSITDVDYSQCELAGKVGCLNKLSPFTLVVGNQKNATHRTLAEALAVAVDGDKIRVMDGETISTTISTSLNNISIICDPGVEYVKGSAATGFTFSGDGVRFENGRISGFSTSGNKAINLTGDYSSVLFTRFSNNDTDIADANGTASQVGVINE